jgi:hypothetical protein
MANLLKSICLLFLFLFLFSCDKKDGKLYEFDPDNLVENKITLDEFADDIQYIPLDSSYPIRLIYNCYFIGNSIYLNTTDVGILKFNSKGELVKKIGAIGRGPGEYTHYLTFSVDDKLETVYVKDSGNRIQVYSGNGTFLKTISVQGYGGTVEWVSILDSKLVLFNFLMFGNAKYNWIILDTLGNLIKTKERPNPVFESNYLGRVGTYYVNNNLCYWNVYNDTVYTISPDLNEKASFLISPRKHRFPRAHFNPIDKLAQYMNIQSIIETERYIMMKYSIADKQSFALIEKKSRKSFICNLDENYKGGIINNLDGGPEFLPTYSFQKNKNEYLVGLLDAYKLKAYVASDAFKNSTPKYPEKKKELENLANKLNETDNPVLVMVRLKK